MKKIYSSLSILAIIALSSSAFGQSTTITSATMPQIGFVYSNSSDTAAADMPGFVITAGSAVAQTWNYSTQFNNIYPESTSFLTPSAGLGNSNFPGANMTAAQDTNWAYFVSTTSGLNVDGAYAAINNTYVAIDYVPNQIVIPFPYTYGNTTNNVYGATFTISGAIAHHHANRTISADAFGSLTTPAGTYPNTLRIKTIEVTTDSVFAGTILVFSQSDSTTNYAWMQNTQDSRLMSIDIDITGAVVKAQYMQSFSNGIATVNAPYASFNLYPNPATDITYFTYENKTTGPVTVQLFDLGGRQIAQLLNENQVMGKQKLAINVGALHLPKGLYFLQVNSNNSLQTIKLSVN